MLAQQIAERLFVEKDLLRYLLVLNKNPNMEQILQFLTQFRPSRFKLRTGGLSFTIEKHSKKAFSFFESIRSIGTTSEMDDYEKRKLGIFNLLNFFQVLTGMIVPVATIFSHLKSPFGVSVIASLPSIVGIFILVLNLESKYKTALICYFLFYPLFTCIIYINGIDSGQELSFIFYGILAVFFLNDIGYMLFAICFSMVNYFVLFILLRGNAYHLHHINSSVYLLNQLLAIIYIFYALYLIKWENSNYQFSILQKNRKLHQKNLEIEEQKRDISAKAQLVETQAAILKESNAVKSKLFSIISHDLKGPIYALRNVFQQALEYQHTGQQVKEIIPEIMKDLNFSAELIENLLHWAKCQMNSEVMQRQKLNVSKLADQTVHLLRLQLEQKKICLKTKTALPAYAYADSDMVSLVLRNLLSNAIKFTPEGGCITIETYESASCIEVYVQDSGSGISREAMKKISQNIFYTTTGTKSETGTGLGLMLCKEFLQKNEGRLMIESEPGKGSTFSFTLPLS